MLGWGREGKCGGVMERNGMGKEGGSRTLHPHNDLSH